MEKTCAHCGKTFSVIRSRENTAKFCSRACSDSHPRSDANVECDHCHTRFHMKPSQIVRYPRSLGVFCSTNCLSEAKRIAYEGSRNPNYKGKNVNSDGYRVYPPSARRLLGHKLKLVHQVVACESLGIQSVPSGYHVHHRDCNVMNNAPENLVVLSISDHKWLHKQFGVASLWAFCKGLIGMQQLCEWADDKDRARRLLPLNVLVQRDSGFGSTGG